LDPFLRWLSISWRFQSSCVVASCHFVVCVQLISRQRCLSSSSAYPSENDSKKSASEIIAAKPGGRRPRARDFRRASGKACCARSEVDLDDKSGLPEASLFLAADLQQRLILGINGQHRLGAKTIAIFSTSLDMHLSNLLYIQTGEQTTLEKKIAIETNKRSLSEKKREKAKCPRATWSSRETTVGSRASGKLGELKNMSNKDLSSGRSPAYRKN